MPAYGRTQQEDEVCRKARHAAIPLEKAVSRFTGQCKHRGAPDPREITFPTPVFQLTVAGVIGQELGREACVCVGLV